MDSMKSVGAELAERHSACGISLSLAYGKCAPVLTWCCFRLISKT